jgi:hypothetical protein
LPRVVRNAWDTSKPNGTPKKRLDVSRLAALASTVTEFRQSFQRQLLRQA